MRKRSLFWRIFAWFWLCVTLVAASNVLVLLLDRPQAFMDEHRQRSARMLRMLAEGQALPDPGTRTWVEKIKDDLGMTILLFDGTGRPLDAATTPPEAARALSLAMAGQDPAHVETGQGYWLAVPVNDGSRRMYAASMVRVRRPRPTPFSGRSPSAGAWPSCSSCRESSVSSWPAPCRRRCTSCATPPAGWPAATWRPVSPTGRWGGGMRSATWPTAST